MPEKRIDNNRADAKLGDLSPNKALGTVREQQQQQQSNNRSNSE